MGAVIKSVQQKMQLTVGEKLTRLAARPERTGIWFLVSRTCLGDFDHEELCDVHTEFLGMHPNGLDMVAEFVAVKLSAAQIKKHRERIRMASYRWKGVCSLDEGKEAQAYAIPHNYGWFLNIIREQQLLGWMDWMAHVGVNVPLQTVLSYMGQLYSELVTVSEWMYSPEALTQMLKRGWIFQESAFGELDAQGCANMLARVRGLFKEARASGSTDKYVAFVDGATYLSKLLERRGFEGRVDWEKDASGLQKLAKLDFAYYGMGRFGSNLANLIVGQHRDSLTATHRKISENYAISDGVAYVATLGALSATDEEYADLSVAFLDVLVRPGGHAHLDAFYGTFGHSLVLAIWELDFTFEADRPIAVTAVAKAIVETVFESPSTDMIHRCWMASTTRLIKWAIDNSEPGYKGSASLKGQASEAAQHGFFGDLRLSGARIVRDGSGRTAPLKYASSVDGATVTVTTNDALAAAYRNLTSKISVASKEHERDVYFLTSAQPAIDSLYFLVEASRDTRVITAWIFWSDATRTPVNAKVEALPKAELRLGWPDQQ